MRTPGLAVLGAGMWLLVAACGLLPTLEIDSNEPPVLASQHQGDPTRNVTDLATMVPTEFVETRVPEPNVASETTTSEPISAPSPAIRRLTSGGCCVGPVFTPDGSQVIFIDRPAPDQPAGLWGVPVDGGVPRFLTDRLGVFSQDRQYRAFPLSGQTYVERLETGERWMIPNGGRAVSISPNGLWVAWTAGQFGPPFDTALREVWVGRVDGTGARQVFSAIRGGFGGWLGENRLLVSGLVEDGSDEQAFWALDLTTDGEVGLLELGRGGRLREPQISPDGQFLAYLATFSEGPNQNGIWLVDTITGEALNVPEFGGYRWRDNDHLLVVPMDLNQPVHRLLQIDATSLAVDELTDPAVAPFRIANGDWAVSGNGNQVVFVSAEDSNIWIIDLNPS